MDGIRRHRRRSRRAGVETVELILVLPVLLLVFFVAFQFAMAMITQAAVTHAAIVGTREAAKRGTVDNTQARDPYPGIDEVVGDTAVDPRDEINEVLDVVKIEIVNPDTGKRVVLEDATATYDFGDTALNDKLPTTPASPSTDEVRVTVAVAFDSLKSDGVSKVLTIFNMLDCFDFTNDGQIDRFQASALAKKE